MREKERGSAQQIDRITNIVHKFIQKKSVQRKTKQRKP